LASSLSGVWRIITVVMASQPVPYVTPEEYLKFDRGSEFRHEYVFGEIVAMAGGTYRHSKIAANTTRALGNHLSNRPCGVLEGNLRVALHREALYSYPDGTVVCGEPEFLDTEADTLTNPKLVVEVLSPATRNYDLGDKTRMYWQIPSLTDLLLIEQDKVWIEYWSREPGGKWDRKLANDLGEVLKIESLDCELPLAEIYSGVGLTKGRRGAD
jgi:Uma2 family endonuclease